MAKSILTTVKTNLGLEAQDDSFDCEIISWINAAFVVLRQIGVGPSTGFSISEETASTITWDNYPCSIIILELVKSYVNLYTRKMFDPPTSSFLMDSINKQLDEYIFRLNIDVDPEV